MLKWDRLCDPSIHSDLCPLGFCTGADFDGIAPVLFINTDTHGAEVIVDGGYQRKTPKFKCFILCARILCF